MSYIFISYSHKDKEYAHRLEQELKQRSFEVWLDDRIDYGSQWPKTIEKKLEGCGAMVLIMTVHSYKSEWVQNELTRAKRRQKEVFPLLLEGDGPWLSVETTQYVDVRGGKLPPKGFYDTLGKFVLRKDAGDSETIEVKPTKDSPLLVNAAPIARTIGAETSDEKIILERISKQLEKAIIAIRDKDLDELTYLGLTSANIRDYSFLSRLKSLQELYLPFNQLTTLPEAIGKLTTIQKLYLFDNQLTTLPETIGKLTVLQTLCLYNNQLTTLPEAIGKLTALQELDIRINQLTTLPEAIGKLISLQELYLDSNKITTLPETIGKLTLLQTLSLHNNQLTTLPEAIGKLTALKMLHLFDNQFSEEEKVRVRELVPQDCYVYI